MKALYIAGAVVLFLILPAVVRIKVFFCWCGKAVSLKIKMLCFSAEREISAAEAKEAAKEAAEKKKAEKAKKGAAKAKPKEKKTPTEIKEALELILSGVKKLLRRFKRYARLEQYTLKIDLGTGDPAKTALLYGALSGPVAALHALALSVKRRPRRKDAVCTEFKPDFYADRTDAFVEIGFSLRMWQIAACLSAALGDFLKCRRRSRKAKAKSSSNGAKGSTKENIKRNKKRDTERNAEENNAKGGKKDERILA